MSLLSKLIKNSTIDDKSILSKSKFFNEKDMIQTEVPMVNVALSAALKGGLTPGVTMIAGPSKHFKTCFSLLMAKAYLDKYDDAVVLFYDSEFGTPQGYFARFNIDPERVLHVPVTDAEQLKHDLVTQLSNLERGEHVFIVLDSLGNLASKKEVDDALDGKNVADMSRAKQFKSLFRMITPHLTLKDVPMVVVNHTYKEIGMYPKDIVGGGTGSYYSSDTIWIIGRRQLDGADKGEGYHFVINVEKSRYVKEKSQIFITVKWDGGIDRYSGLFDAVLEAGIIKQGGSWYTLEDGRKVQKKELLADIDYWEDLLENEKFGKYITSKYAI
jgi:RecA/RadA recombinase